MSSLPGLGSSAKCPALRRAPRLAPPALRGRLAPWGRRPGGRELKVKGEGFRRGGQSSGPVTQALHQTPAVRLGMSRLPCPLPRQPKAVSAAVHPRAPAARPPLGSCTPMAATGFPLSEFRHRPALARRTERCSNGDAFKPSRHTRSLAEPSSFLRSGGGGGR